MGSSPTEYAEFTEPPAEMSSHGFHRFTQILRVRCSPTEFTESTEFGSVGMAGMPYPPTSVNIRVICGRLFSARSFCVFRAFCGNIFSPTDFTDLHRCEGAFKGVHLSQVHQPSKKCTNRAIGTFCFVGAVLALASGKDERRQLHQLDWQRGYGRDAIPSYICAHLCHLWEAFLCQKFPCVPCVLWESLYSHGFHSKFAEEYDAVA